MIEITNHVTNFIYVVEGSSYAINKDMWDYAGILGAAAAPVIAIVFSIWNHHQIKLLKEEDRSREEERHEKEEIRTHYQEINKFIDEKLWFLHESSEQEFINTIIKLQSMVSKLGMISHDRVRDQIVYYISAYIEVAYFLLTEKQNPDKDLLSSRQFFLNSVKEFDILLVNKDLSEVQKKVAQFNEKLIEICQ